MSRPSLTPNTTAAAPGQPVFKKKNSIVQEKDGYHGPSIIGLIAGKRFAKRMSQRYRKSSMSTSTTARSWTSGQNVKLEPTYRMEPGQKFQPAKVKEIMKAVVQSRMTGFSYSSRMASMMTKVLTEEIKEKVKALRFDRYKIICLVSIGENKGQSVNVSSRCIWDDKVDSFATHSFETKDSYCNVIVYGIYHE